MYLFKTRDQQVTILNEDRDVLIQLSDALRASNNKASINDLKLEDKQWQLSLRSSDARALYDKYIYPQLQNPIYVNCSLMIQINDKRSAQYSQELLVSLQLDSGLPFGAQAESNFINDLCISLADNHEEYRGVVEYYIVGGGAVTFAVPCADPIKLEQIIHTIFQSYPITKYLINTVLRDSP